MNPAPPVMSAFILVLLREVLAGTLPLAGRLLQRLLPAKPGLLDLVKSLEKQFGSGCIMRLGGAAHVDVPAIPSGSLGLDLALGGGGYPRGRLVEIYGPESGGKTTLALTAIAQAQRQGGICAFVDAEHQDAAQLLESEVRAAVMGTGTGDKAPTDKSSPSSGKQAA